MKIIKVSAATALLIIYACNSSTSNNSSIAGSGGNKNEMPVFVKSLVQRVSQYPDSASLRLQLATALDSIGAFKEAVAQMDSLTLNDSTNFGLWFAKGEIAEDAKDTALAIGSYIKAVKIYPSPDAQLSLANLYAEKKKAESLLICSRVKNMGLGREKDADCAFISGVYFARTGNREAALKSFDECIANNYTYLEAYIEKGLLYFDNKQYNEALNIFSLAATVNNLYADAYYYQARCYEMMNKKDSAIQKFQQSLGLDKTLEQAHDGLKRLGAE